MTPTSSSSTPARSSTAAKERASTPSSRWRRTRSPRRAPRGGWWSPGAWRSATRMRSPRRSPRSITILGSADFQALAKALADAPAAKLPSGKTKARKSLPVIQVSETPGLHLRSRFAARADRRAPLGVRQDRRGLRSPVLVLHHPQAARPAAQPHDRDIAAEVPSPGRRGRPRDQPDRAGPDPLRLGSGQLAGDPADPGASSLRQPRQDRCARVDPPPLHLPERVRRRADRRDRQHAEGRQVHRRAAPAHRRRMLKRMRRGHSSKRDARADRSACASGSTTSSSAPPSSSVTPARPRRSSTSCCEFVARPSSIAPARSRTRSSRAPRRRCCRTASPRTSCSSASRADGDPAQGSRERQARPWSARRSTSSSRACPPRAST
jgi:hypothetical protein